MEINLTPEELTHLISKEMHNNKKHTKHTISWSLLSVIAKIKKVLGQNLMFIQAQTWVGVNFSH